MSYWIDDPQLFLYAKGTGPDDVFLRRCNKPVSSSSSSLVVPMKSEDFEYESDVKKYRLLIRDEFEWDETDYNRLVKYIYERALLVNRQGLVIAEIYKLDDANLMVPIYIRSLDVLPLKPYIPNIRERLIPLRTVKCLEDVNGKAAAMMEDMDSNLITKLTAKVDDLESKNKTLDTNVKKLIAGQVALTDDLESKNKTLEDKVTNLTADLATQMDALATLQRQLNRVMENANYKETTWMNDFTYNKDWVGIEELQSLGTASANVFIISPMGTFTVDDSSTNVRARYWYKVRFLSNNDDKVISLEDLSPNKEMARFSKRSWVFFTSKGKPYVLKS